MIILTVLTFAKDCREPSEFPAPVTQYRGPSALGARSFCVVSGSG